MVDCFSILQVLYCCCSVSVRLPTSGPQDFQSLTDTNQVSSMGRGNLSLEERSYYYDIGHRIYCAGCVLSLWYADGWTFNI